MGRGEKGEGGEGEGEGEGEGCKETNERKQEQESKLIFLGRLYLDMFYFCLYKYMVVV